MADSLLHTLTQLSTFLIAVLMELVIPSHDQPGKQTLISRSLENLQSSETNMNILFHANLTDVCFNGLWM